MTLMCTAQCPTPPTAAPCPGPALRPTADGTMRPAQQAPAVLHPGGGRPAPRNGPYGSPERHMQQKALGRGPQSRWQRGRKKSGCATCDAPAMGTRLPDAPSAPDNPDRLLPGAVGVHQHIGTGRQRGEAPAAAHGVAAGHEGPGERVYTHVADCGRRAERGAVER